MEGTFFLPHNNIYRLQSYQPEEILQAFTAQILVCLKIKYLDQKESSIFWPEGKMLQLLIG